MPRPVQPEGAALEGVLPRDPLGVRRAVLPVLRPRTRRVLEGEFALTRRQAHAAAVCLAKHRSLRGARVRAMVRFWGWVAIAALCAGVLIGPVAWEAYEEWAIGLPEGHFLLRLVSFGVSAVLVVVGLGLWAGAERWIHDGLVERELRRCWNDQECIWCGRDMDGCVVDRERWSRCPECGLRSPIGARASTI